MNRLFTTIALVAVGLTVAPLSEAQRSGQSITIVHGTVIGARSVQEQSDAGKGALLGGTIGYATTSSSRSSKSKRRNAAIGAVAGAALASGAQGDRSAKEYTVETGAGTTIIISDQTQIVVGDCVIVENAGGNSANIRRVDPVMCEPESAEVVQELAEEFQEEAEECVSAKLELAAAQDDPAFDRALRKVEILCNN
jgi:outer membrane lipoprotein SlyB